MIFNFLEIFASLEDTKRICNLMVDLLKFTFNKNILSTTNFVT